MDREAQIYRTGRAGGLSWTYRPGSEDLISPDYSRAQLVDADENRVRIRGRYKTGGETYFVKVFKEAGLGRSVKSMLLGHVAKKEFSASRYLSSRGIPTPEAVAVGTSPGLEDRAVIIFREIAGATPVRDLFLKAGPAERGKYLDRIAEMTAALHRASFHHRDYHGGNLLSAIGEAGDPQLWVVDLHRSSFPRDMSGKRGVDNIADVLHSLLPVLEQEDIARFLSRYREKYPGAAGDAAAAARVIEKRIRKIEARRLKSRTRRCFIDSTGFFVSKNRSEILFGRRGVSPGEITGLIDQFAGGRGRVIKRDKKASVALMETDQATVCIKAYEHPGAFGRIKAMFGRSRGHNSWRAAQGLFLRGFETPRHLGLVVRRHFFVPRAVYLVTESIAPRLEMDRFILKNLGAGGTGVHGRFAADLGTVIGSLHRAGVYHRDLKATNIAVGEKGDGFSFAFLDLDAVTFAGRVPVLRRAKNLSQLYLSVPGVIDAGRRRAFFEAYVSASGGQREAKTVARLVGNLVRDKDILYVSENGDVIEDAGALYEELWGDR